MLVKELSRACGGSSSSSRYTPPLALPRITRLSWTPGTHPPPVIHPRATRPSCRGTLVIDNQDEFTLKQWRLISRSHRTTRTIAQFSRIRLSPSPLFLPASSTILHANLLLLASSSPRESFPSTCARFSRVITTNTHEHTFRRGLDLWRVALSRKVTRHRNSTRRPNAQITIAIAANSPLYANNATPRGESQTRTWNTTLAGQAIFPTEGVNRKICR